MGQRLVAETLVYEGLNDIDPSGTNSTLMKQFFGAMSDEQFEKWIVSLEKGLDYIPVVMENLNGIRITTRRNIEVAKKWGVKLIQRVWCTDPLTGYVYLTGPAYLTVHLPVRRQIQTLVNKISVPEDNKHVDEMTDQPTGVSKGSSMSFPEILVLYGQGYNKAILELIKFRGGDIPLMNEMDKRIRDNGGVSIDSLMTTNTRVKSTVTLSNLLKAIHFDNNF